METIDIALAADANYFPGLLVTAASLARHAARDVALRFDVLDGGLGEARLAQFRARLSAEHPHTSVRTFAVDERGFTSFPEWTCSSRMTYARLLLAELIEEAESVLYCDVDFLWTADVAELWRLRDASAVLQACTDGWLTTCERERLWSAANGLSFDASRYVCAGLLLVNLRRFRAEGWSRRIMDFLAAHPDVPFVDQTAINAVVPDIRLLPRKWGRFSRELTRAELPGAWAIHYAGGVPWRPAWWTSLLTPADLLWFSFYGELTNQSGRAARRSFLPTGEYAKRRFAYFLSTTPVVRSLFFLFLRFVGRGCYLPYLKGARL